MFDVFEDISKGVEETKVSVDDFGINVEDVTSFVYIRKNIPGIGTKTEDFEDEFQGCSCKKDELCSESVCECIKIFGPSYDNSGILLNVDPYQRAMKPILECGKNCGCSKRCINRVVQNGVQYRLQIFPTNKKGIGLKTMQHIKKNSFVCEYAGEVLDEKVAKYRTERLSNTDCNYILVLRETIGSDKVKTTHVDPTYIGNVGRFINHSCKPNLYMVPVRVDCNVPKLALFALNDIKKDEELGYDYSGNIQNNSEKSSDENNTIQRKKCYCGAENCRGWLPLDPTLYNNVHL